MRTRRFSGFPSSYRVILKTVIQRGVRRTSGISHVVNPNARRETRCGGGKGECGSDREGVRRRPRARRSSSRHSRGTRIRVLFRIHAGQINVFKRGRRHVFRGLLARLNLDRNLWPRRRFLRLSGRSLRVLGPATHATRYRDRVDFVLELVARTATALPVRRDLCDRHRYGFPLLPPAIEDMYIYNIHRYMGMSRARNELRATLIVTM